MNVDPELDTPFQKDTFTFAVDELIKEHSTANPDMFVKKDSYTEQELTEFINRMLKKYSNVYNRLAEI